RSDAHLEPADGRTDNGADSSCRRSCVGRLAGRNLNRIADSDLAATIERDRDLLWVTTGVRRLARRILTVPQAVGDAPLLAWLCCRWVLRTFPHRIDLLAFRDMIGEGSDGLAASWRMLAGPVAVARRLNPSAT